MVEPSRHSLCTFRVEDSPNHVNEYPRAFLPRFPRRSVRAAVFRLDWLVFVGSLLPNSSSREPLSVRDVVRRQRDRVGCFQGRKTTIAHSRKTSRANRGCNRSCARVCAAPRCNALPWKGARFLTPQKSRCTSSFSLARKCAGAHTRNSMQFRDTIPDNRNIELSHFGGGGQRERPESPRK